jgi:DNA-entry nuclease
MKKLALFVTLLLATAGATTTQAQTISYGKVSDYKPTASLAESVMTPTVKAKLGGKVTYNGNGAFIVNNNKPIISVKKTTPYASEPALNHYHQLGTAIAVVNYSTYQSKARTGGTINPAGWHQMTLKGSHFRYLYNRGHALGYAIIGNLKGFNATEKNWNNISAQTAWANQAEGGKEGDGQNYYENIVRNAIKAHKTVKYEVKPIYVGTNLVPVGTEIEAQGIGNSISFNVFVPNVEPAVSINYATGVAKVR